MLENRLFAALALVSATLALGAPSDAQTSAQDPRWTEAVAPFRMADRIYYVGSRELAAYLIDTGKGMILLDAGMPEFAPRLLANIRTLGFDPRQVRFLLNSQAHFDHAGGLAAVKAATGAKMLASAADGALLQRGGKGDFAWGDALAYAPVKVDRILRDGEKLRLGAVTMTAHLTPGHTKGCTTWTMPVSVGGRSLVAQFNCSMSVPGYKLLGNPLYPNIAADYRRSFAKLRRLPCSLFFGAHGSFFDLDAKRARLAAGASANPFIDPQGCRRYIASSRRRFEEQLAREAAVLQK